MILLKILFVPSVKILLMPLVHKFALSVVLHKSCIFYKKSVSNLSLIMSIGWQKSLSILAFSVSLNKKEFLPLYYVLEKQVCYITNLYPLKKH